MKHNPLCQISAATAALTSLLSVTTDEPSEILLYTYHLFSLYQLVLLEFEIRDTGMKTFHNSSKF